MIGKRIAFVFEGVELFGTVRENTHIGPHRAFLVHCGGSVVRCVFPNEITGIEE